jgi:hypothetical protein
MTFSQVNDEKVDILVVTNLGYLSLNLLPFHPSNRVIDSAQKPAMDRSIRLKQFKYIVLSEKGANGVK